MTALRYLLICALLLLPLNDAFAGAGTITTKDASGATQTFVVVTNGSGNFLASGVLCDQSAGANCASVKAASTAAAQTDLGLVVRNPDLGTIGDAAWTSGNGTVIALLKGLYANTAASIAAGSAIIGRTGTDLTTPGTTNGVSVAYIGSTAVDANSGNKGAGTQRIIPATDSLALAAWGQGATGATAPSGATQSGCRSASASPTEVTDGQMSGVQCGLGGRLINLPYAIKEVQVRGTVTSTDGSAHTIIASAGGSLKNYITDWECYNTSATSVTVAFNDSATTTIIVPAGSGNNKSLHIPLATAAATAFQFTASTGVTTVGCSAQGYTGL